MRETKSKGSERLPVHVVIGRGFPDEDSPIRRWVTQYVVDRFADRPNVRVITMGGSTSAMVSSIQQYSPPIVLDGIEYAEHPISGGAAHVVTKAERSLTAPGERFDLATRFATDGRVGATRGRRVLVVPECSFAPLPSLDDEGVQLEVETVWRGIVVCFEIDDGAYNTMAVSLDYLCKLYEHTPLSCFLVA